VGEQVDTEDTSCSRSYEYDPSYDEWYDSQDDDDRTNDSSTSDSSTRDSSSPSVSLSGKLSSRQLRCMLGRLGRRPGDDDSDAGRQRSSRQRYEETESSSETSGSRQRPHHHRRHGGGHHHRRRRRTDNYNTSAMSDTSKALTTTTSTTTSREPSGTDDDDDDDDDDGTSTTESEPVGGRVGGIKSRLVKIVAIAVVKPNGKLDVVEAGIHPWKPTQTGRNCRPSRLRQRSWTGGGSSGALVASGSRARRVGSAHGWTAAGDVQRNSSNHYGHETVLDFSQNNNNSNCEDGQRLVCLLRLTVAVLKHGLSPVFTIPVNTARVDA